jgi:hypothetical protein
MIQEALVRKATHVQMATVDYNICLSASYQVPVLYFSLKNTPETDSPTLDALYQHLVPEAFQANLQTVGVMGGITKGVSRFRQSYRSAAHLHSTTLFLTCRCSSSTRVIRQMLSAALLVIERVIRWSICCFGPGLWAVV